MLALRPSPVIYTASFPFQRKHLLRIAVILPERETRERRRGKVGDGERRPVEERRIEIDG